MKYFFRKTNNIKEHKQYKGTQTPIQYRNFFQIIAGLADNTWFASYFQRVTTDVSNLKAQDILELKERLLKGTASDQDKIHAAALINELRSKNLDYEINPKHDPTTPLGGDDASVIPTNHKSLWDSRCYYDASKKTWWSVEGKGKNAVFHRFKSDGNGTFHWNGSTGKNLNRKGKHVDNTFDHSAVPDAVKKAAGYKYKKGT